MKLSPLLGQFWAAEVDMAQITRRGDLQWRARVRMKGYPDQSRTFLYREDAEKWARALERELETAGFVDRREAEKMTLRAVLERYACEITPTKKCAVIEQFKIDVLLRDSVLPNLKMAALTSAALAAWRDRRLAQVTGATVNREIDVLSAVINHARREWGIHVENPVPYVKRPEKARARERRLSPEEEAYLLAALEDAPRRVNGTFQKAARNPWFAPLVRLALETAMRRGELLALDWQHVNLKRCTAHLPSTKNGDPRTVPLSSRAVDILAGLPRSLSGRVFQTTPMAVQLGFRRALKRARAKHEEDCLAVGRVSTPSFLDDVHFHDLRHEAASRLADKLSNILELSAVTGHRDVRMLKRYYHPRAEDLAKKLG